MMNNKTRLIAWLLPFLWMGLGGGLFAQDLTVCAGKGFTLTSADDAKGDNIVAYKWQENGIDLDDSNAATYHISGKQAGVYQYVRLAITNDCPEGVPSNTFTVTVNAVPTGLSLTSATVCYGMPATLTASATDGYLYSLTGQDDDWHTSKTFTVTPTTTTTYTLYVKHDYGCSATLPDAATVTVHTAVGLATISGNSSNTCPNATVSLRASATAATSYTWYNGNTQVQTGESSAYTVTSSGSYTVQGKNDYCTGQTSSSQVVTINPVSLQICCPDLQLQTTSPSDGKGDWDTANTYCQEQGARLPTIAELQCMCPFRSEANISTDWDNVYWSSSSGGLGYAAHRFYSCASAPGNYATTNSLYFRCVL